MYTNQYLYTLHIKTKTEHTHKLVENKFINTCINNSFTKEGCYDECNKLLYVSFKNDAKHELLKCNSIHEAMQWNLGI